MAYVAAVHQVVPAQDKRDDFRRLIESAASDVFVTGDEDLAKRSQEICPYRPTISLREFEKGFGTVGGSDS
jgi:hypothetical protein